MLDHSLLTTRTIPLSSQNLTVWLPADPDQLLDHAIANRSSDPYWGVLWSAAIPMAEYVLQMDWPRANRAIELGCGIGLVGLSAIMAGLDVTFSDCVPEAVELAVLNADRNGFAGTGSLLLNWKQDVPVAHCRSFDVILCSDVLYDEENHRPLLTVADQLLTDDGMLILGDPGRQAVAAFLWLADDLGWESTKRTHAEGSLILMELTRPG